MRDQRGFTLIEMMIAVAVVAILAVIAVPAYFSQTRKSKASSETGAMFAELSTKEEQYKVDFGGYFGTSNTAITNAVSTSAACPATPLSTGQSISACLTDATWTTLHINPPDNRVYCSYKITAGPGGAAATVPSGFSLVSDGSNPVPITAWYFILASCDMDGSATTNSSYFMSSLDTKIQVQNAGF